jgi:hypothetical protein
MPDPLEEAQSMAYALDTRSVYSRIGITPFYSSRLNRTISFSFNL